VPPLLCPSPIKAGRQNLEMNFLTRLLTIHVFVGGCAFSAVVESNEVYTLPNTKFISLWSSLFPWNFYVEMIFITGPIQYRTRLHACMYNEVVFHLQYISMPTSHHWTLYMQELGSITFKLVKQHAGFFFWVFFCWFFCILRMWDSQNLQNAVSLYSCM